MEPGIAAPDFRVLAQLPQGQLRLYDGSAELLLARESSAESQQSGLQLARFERVLLSSSFAVSYASQQAAFEAVDFSNPSLAFQVHKIEDEKLVLEISHRLCGGGALLSRSSRSSAATRQSDRQFDVQPQHDRQAETVQTAVGPVPTPTEPTAKAPAILPGIHDTTIVCGVKGSGMNGLLAYVKGVADIGVWDIAKNETVVVLSGHSKPILSICAVPSPLSLPLVASLHSDGLVCLWDIASSRLAHSFDFAGNATSLMVAGSPDRPVLILADRDATLSMWSFSFQDGSIVPEKAGESIAANKLALEPSASGPSESKAFLEWVNYFLAKIGVQITNISTDLHDGFFLILLIEIVTKKGLGQYRTRMARDTPIDNPLWIGENRAVIAKWINEFGQQAETSQLSNMSDAGNTFVKICTHVIACLSLWAVLAFICKLPRITRNPVSNFKLAEDLFNSNNIPFPYSDLPVQQWGNVVLLRASILIDKTNSRNTDEATKSIRWVPPPQRFETVTPIPLQVYDQGVLRIFLSSTFRDMQNERDQFFQHGVSQLKALAKGKGLELVFIDLRWGLTAEDSGDGWVVIRCCESIEKCAYFVCFLGARYGWVPDAKKANEWHPETNKRFPFLNSIPGLSVTEYEIQYAALIDKPAASRVFFYFRDEKYAIDHAKSDAERILFAAVDETDRRRQEELKKKIQSQYDVLLYKGARVFSDFVTSQLKFAINKDFGQQQIREPEDQAHYQFMKHRLAGFEGREELLANITSHVMAQLDTDSKEIGILAAESGIGKSSLMAATVRKLEGLGLQDLSVFYHFVGCTNLSNYVESISIRFWKYVQNSSESGDVQESKFKNEGLDGLIRYLSLKNPKRRLVFLIDAINQIYPSQETPVPHSLTWLPKKTPKNVALIVSTINTHESCLNLVEAGMPVIPVTKLSKTEIGLASVGYLHRYDKKLTDEQLSLIVGNDRSTGHPLFLRLVLEELRIFGIYEKLSDELQTLLSNSSVQDLYTLIINRWKAKFEVKDVNMVERVMKVLLVSRIGLSESELDLYLRKRFGVKFNIAEWKSFFFTLADSLFVRNGRYMYFHQLLIETVQSLFFPAPEDKKESQQDYGMWLYGTYAQNESVEEELSAEICHQLLQGECHDALVEYLKHGDVAMKMLKGRYRYEFFTCWRELERLGVADCRETYEQLIQGLDEVGSTLVDFFLESQKNSFLNPVLLQRIARHTNDAALSHDYLSLGRVYKNLNNLKDSMACLQKCLDIKRYSSIEEDESMANLLDEIGETYRMQGELGKALENYQRSLDIFSKNGDIDINVAQSHDRFGTIFLMQKRFDEASIHFEKAMEIRSKIVGDQHPHMSTSLTNMGNLQKAQNKMEDALVSYEKALSILRKTFGNQHPSVASSLYDIALVYECDGRLTDAVSLLHESVAIYVKVLGGNHAHVVSVYQKIGDISFQLENFKQALSAYTTTLEVRKRTLSDTHIDIAPNLEYIGCTNLLLNRKDQVLEYFLEAAKIRKDTKSIASIQDVRLCMRILELALGSKDHDVVEILYRTIIHTTLKKSGYRNLSAFSLCTSLNSYYEQHYLHSEAITFWNEMKELYTKELGWDHIRTLNCCEYLSIHSEKNGPFKEPAQYSRVEAFISENVAGFKPKPEWDRPSIISGLFEILFRSKNDESLAPAASSAITFLNFMNVSFSGMNLEKIKISGANMKGSLVIGTKFENAVLDGVDFENSVIGDADFNSSNIANINLGITHNKLALGGDTTCYFCFYGHDGKQYIACGTKSGSLVILDMFLKATVKTLNRHSEPITSICQVQSPGGERWIASCSSDASICIWNISTLNHVRTIYGHAGGVNSICAVKGPKGQTWLASGGDDKTVRVWNIVSGDPIHVLQGHPWQIRSVCAMQGPDGSNWLVSGCTDSLFIWDVESGEVVKTADNGVSSHSSLCVARYNGASRLLLSSSGGNTVRAWDAWSSKKAIELLPFTFGDINCINVIDGPNGEAWLLVGHRTGQLSIRDLECDFELHRIVKEGQASPILQILPLTSAKSEPLLWLALQVDKQTLEMHNLNAFYAFNYQITQANVPPPVSLVRVPGREDCLITREVDNSLQIFDFAGQVLVKYNLRDIIVTKERSIALTDDPSTIIASFQTASEANRMVKSSLEFNYSTKSTTQVGNATLHRATGLTYLVKTHFLVHGGSTYDLDHVSYCQDVHFTPFQGLVCAQCYEHGWGGVVQHKMEACRWYLKLIKEYGYDVSYQELERLAKSGWDEALEVLNELVSEDRKQNYGNPQYDRASSIVSLCHVNGWGVPKDDDPAIELYMFYMEFDQNKTYDFLHNLVQSGSTKAFSKLLALAKEKTTTFGYSSDRGSYVEEDCKNPKAIALVIECYANGWGVERSPSLCVRWKLEESPKSTEHVAELARLAKEENDPNVFGILADLAFYKVGDNLKFPTVGPLLWECYEKGWGISKSDPSVVETIMKCKLNADPFDEEAYTELRRQASEGSTRIFTIASELIRNCVSMEEIQRHPFCIFLAAECLVNGWGVPVNEKEAQGIFERIIKAGDPNVAAILRRMAQQGTHKTFKLISSLVEGGSKSDTSPELIHLLSDCYRHGWGVDINLPHALAYLAFGRIEDPDPYPEFQELVKQGSVEGFSMLERISSMIEGGVPVYPKAVELITLCFQNGWSVEKNELQVLKWKVTAHPHSDEYWKTLEDLARENNAPAFGVLQELTRMSHISSRDSPYFRVILFVGQCYENGWGVEKSFDKAASHYQEFIHSDIERVCDELVRLCQENITEAFTVLESTSAGRNWEGSYNIPVCVYAQGLCLENGWGVELNTPLAYEKYRELAEMGFDKGFERLQELVLQHSVEAFEAVVDLAGVVLGTRTGLMKSSKDHDPVTLPKVASLLKTCYDEGLCVEKNETTALKWAFFSSSDEEKHNILERLKEQAGQGSADAALCLIDLASLKQKVSKYDDQSKSKLALVPKAAEAVAHCYQNGWGVEKDLKKAEEWANVARPPSAPKQQRQGGKGGDCTIS